MLKSVQKMVVSLVVVLGIFSVASVKASEPEVIYSMDQFKNGNEKLGTFFIPKPHHGTIKYSVELANLKGSTLMEPELLQGVFVNKAQEVVNSSPLKRRLFLGKDLILYVFVDPKFFRIGVDIANPGSLTGRIMIDMDKANLDKNGKKIVIIQMPEDKLIVQVEIFDIGKSKRKQYGIKVTAVYNEEDAFKIFRTFEGVLKIW
jgi:hypothetical protein